MQVVGFVGSPRVRGNTELLVAEALKGAASAGADTEIVALNKLTISTCQACDSCRKTGRCRIQDDMQPLYNKVLNADALILGTPIYFWGPSAQLKTFIDRWYSFTDREKDEKLAGKRLALICVHADTDMTTADAAVIIVRRTAQWYGMDLYEPLLAVAGDRGVVAQDATILRRAFDLGAALATGRS